MIEVIDEYQCENYARLSVTNQFGRQYMVVVDVEKDAGPGEVRVYDLAESPDEPSSTIEFAAIKPEE